MKYLLVNILMLAAALLYGQTCSKPFAVTYEFLNVNDVKVKWISSGGNISHYQIAYADRGEPVQNVEVFDSIFDKNFTLIDLVPASQYWIYVQAVCSDASLSGWNGPFLLTTLFSNPSPCGTQVEIKDESCPTGGELFLVDIKQKGILGQTIFVESVELQVDHPWLADLEIILENPSGSETILSQYNGAAQDNFGITCDTLTRFSSNACVGIEDGDSPFVGVYKPRTSLTALNDGTPAEGIWRLKICDRASGDKGTLKYLKINLVPRLCEPIVDQYINYVTDTSAMLHWIAPINCEGIRIEYGPTGFTPNVGIGSVKQLNCKNQKVLMDGLEPGLMYDYYLTGDCIASLAAPSCVASFQTLCSKPTIVENFNSETICENSCSRTCDINTMWSNGSSDNSEWLIWEGETETVGTGPSADVDVTGRYLYVESNPILCGDRLVAELNSGCLMYRGNSGCGLSFQYFMEGEDEGHLTLYVSEDELKWDTLFTVSNSVGWELAQIDMSPYEAKGIFLKFVAETGFGDKKDIALDEIILYGEVELGPFVYYQDLDNDGYGNRDSAIIICGIPIAGYVDNQLDCNDKNEAINPQGIEVGCNGIDENCNGMSDDNTNAPIVTANIISESCSGLSDGAIEISLEGSFGPYTVQWNNGQQGEKISSLKAGFYRATITDATSCISMTPFYEVKAESKITMTVERLVNATCQGRRDGEIVVKPTGGVPPYTYQWPFDQIQATVIGLLPGKYAVTITDAEGCEFISDSIKVDVNDPIKITEKEKIGVKCHGESNGSIELEASNGKAPYLFRWANGRLGPKLTNLIGGKYQVQVSDVLGCTENYIVNIPEPKLLTVELINVEEISCFEAADGAIQTHTSGGTAPFQYSWNTGHSTDDIQGLSAGKYALYVRDTNGCEVALDTIELDEPPPLSLVISEIKSASCRLSNDGLIKLSLAGGSPPYNHFWRRTEGVATEAINIRAGNYGFTATDKNGCKIGLPGIDVPFGNVASPIDMQILQRYRCPNENNAIIAASIEQGAPPLNFNWSNGQSHTTRNLRDTIVNLGPDKYTVTITDAEGCVSVSPIVGFDPILPFSHQVTSFRANKCVDDVLGAIGVEVVGGTRPYIYNWSNAKNTPLIIGLANGEYKLNVIDENECEYIVGPFAITSESNLSLEAIVSPAAVDDDDGKIEIIPSDGVPPYMISWTPDTLQGFEVERLAPGLFQVKVTDAIGCENDTLVEVTRLSAVEQELMNQLTVYPNPTDGIVNISSPTVIGEIQVYNAIGQEVLRHAVKGSELSVNIPEKGIFWLKIVSGGIIIMKRVIVTE